MASPLPGDGSGTMNVLFITGNYYDINVLEQTNIVSDSDIVVQTLDQRRSGLRRDRAAMQLGQRGAAGHAWSVGRPVRRRHRSTPRRRWSRPTSSPSRRTWPPSQSTVVLGDPAKLASEAAALIVHGPTPTLPPPEEVGGPAAGRQRDPHDGRPVEQRPFLNTRIDIGVQ